MARTLVPSAKSRTDPPLSPITSQLRGKGRFFSAASSLRRLGLMVAFFSAWELAAYLRGSPLLPGFRTVVQALRQDAQSGDLWRHAQPTFTYGLTALLVATVAGIGIGLAMGRSRVTRAALAPFLAATYPIPRLALYPVMILVFGIGGPSIVALATMECVYPIIYNTFSGARAVDVNLVRAGQNAGVARWRLDAQVVFVGSLSSILAGIRIAVPIMLVVVVVAEMLSGSQGLGFLIRSHGAQFAVEGALGIVLFLGIVGYALDRLIVFAASTIVFWERGLRNV